MTDGGPKMVPINHREAIMSAACETRQPKRRPATLLAALLLAAPLLGASCAWGQAPAPLAERLAEIREINRFVPEKALPMLQAIEAQARAASVSRWA